MSSETNIQPSESHEDPVVPGQEFAFSSLSTPSITDDEQENLRRSDVDAVTETVEKSRPRVITITTVIIAVLLGLHVVYFARTILMPIVAAGMLALLFRPVIRRFRRYRIPDAASAAFVLMLVVSLILACFGNLIGPANQWLNDAPENLRTVGKKLHVLRDQVDDLSRASEVVEDLAQGEIAEEETAEPPYPFAPESDGEVPPAPSENEETVDATVASSLDEVREGGSVTTDLEVDEPIAVQVQQPRLLAGLQILSSTGSVLAELLIMLVLAYFLLAAGDVLLNNVLRTLPSRKEKRSTVELVHRVEQGISSYLLTVTVINLCLGTCVAFAMWLLVLPNPILWGAMAALFNFVPYLGPLCGTIIVLLVSILSFDSLGYAMLPPLVFWLMTATEGNFITPHLLGRSMSLNPIMVFLSLTIWGWMWGIGGALLAVPILAVLKVSFDQFERTQALGTLLGGDTNA